MCNFIRLLYSDTMFPGAKEPQSDLMFTNAGVSSSMHSNRICVLRSFSLVLRRLGTNYAQQVNLFDAFNSLSVVFAILLLSNLINWICLQQVFRYQGNPKKAMTISKKIKLHE